MNIAECIFTEVLVLVSAVLYCQSIVIGIDNSFHEYCKHS